MVQVCNGKARKDYLGQEASEYSEEEAEQVDGKADWNR